MERSKKHLDNVKTKLDIYMTLKIFYSHFLKRFIEENNYSYFINYKM